MNQAARAAERPPAGATASCCPMLNPFITFGPQVTSIPPPPPAEPFSFAGRRAAQIQPMASVQQAPAPPPATQQQFGAVPLLPTVSQQSAVSSAPERLQQPQRPQDHHNQGTNSVLNLNSNNNYNTSYNGSSLSLQHLLANRHPATNCMALAAALASASFPHFQQLQQQQQQQQSQQNLHQPSTTTNSTINQNHISNSTLTANNISTNPVLQVNPNPAPAPVVTNQVPMPNFNSYTTTPQNLNLPASNAPPQPPSVTALPQAPAQQAPAQQHQHQHQQQQTIPTLPFYPPPLPQMEQALALLTNPQVANNIFNQIFTNLYYQSGLSSEQHAHHNPSHHFHPLHGPHHHHHRGVNGQGNGQDASVPVDSLAISESKPKGLNRAEIDSLTHYIHTDEKDFRTCVICLSRFELKSKIRPLSCNHAFHAKCVDKWLRANRTCPICRRDALKTYDRKIKRIS